MIRVERLDRGEDVVVGEHHALRRPGRARGEDQLRRCRPVRAAPRRPASPPSRAGTRVVVGGFGARARRRWSSGTARARPRAGRARRGRCRGSRWRGSAPRRCSRSPRPTCAGPAARRRAAPASPRSRRPASSGIDGDQVRIRSPGSRPSARSRHAAIRLRRRARGTSSALVDAVVGAEAQARPVADSA